MSGLRPEDMALYHSEADIQRGDISVKPYKTSPDSEQEGGALSTGKETRHQEQVQEK